MNIHPILDRMYADRVICCIQPWCARASKLTRAQLFIGLNGQPQMPTCCDCATALQSAGPQPIELWYIDDDLRAQWWAAIDGAIGGGTPPPMAPPEPPGPPAAAPKPGPARKPASGLSWMITGICALASLILGIVIVAADHNPDSLHAWGNVLIVVPLVPAGLALLLLVLIGPIALACDYDNKQQRQAREQGRHSPHLSAGDAALWAAGVAAMYDMHRRHQRAREDLQAQRAAYRAEQDRRQAQATQEAILDQLRRQNAPAAPFYSRGTPVSDIYGNVTYRKQPWP